MATISNQYDPNDPNAQPNSGGSGTVMPATGVGAPTSGGPGASSTPASPPNVQAYLNANKGAGQQLTQGITNNVQNQANKVDQNVTSAQNQLNTQYQPLASNLDANKAQGMAQTAFKDPQALLDSYNAAKTQSSNSPLTANQQQGAAQYNQFQQLNSGGYNPQIQKYGAQTQQQNAQLQAQAGNINQAYGNSANEMGRGQLLQKAIGNPNYNQGQQTLDTLFLQGQPGQTNQNGLSNLQQLQQNLKGISNTTNQQVNSVGADSNAKLQALQGLSSQDQQYIKNLFTGGLNDISTGVKSQYENLTKQAPQDYANIQDAIKNNTLNDDQLKSLGLAPGTHTWGLDTAKAGDLAYNPIAAANNGGYAQAANQQEFARYNALNQLAGGPSGLQPSIFGQSTTAGGYNPYSFNTNKFNTSVDTAKKAIADTDYRAALGGAVGMTNGQTGGGPGFHSAYNVPTEITSAMNTLRDGLANGTVDPDQANQIIQKMNSDTIAHYGTSGAPGGYIGGLQNFLDYYKNEYQPAANATLGKAPGS